jgi:hypothetical protein
MLENAWNSTLQTTDPIWNTLLPLIKSGIEFYKSNIQRLRHRIKEVLQRMHEISNSLAQYAEINRTLSCELYAAGCTLLAEHKRVM